MHTVEERAGGEFRVDGRLVDVGEPVAFRLRGVAPGDRFEVFPRYLEDCDPAAAAQAQAPLAWLDATAARREELPAGESIGYTPQRPGNYLARWTSARHGVEYRYFAAIDRSYLVYRPVVWQQQVPFAPLGGTALHNGGLPIDWCVEAGSDRAAFVPALLRAQREFGHGVVFAPRLPRNVGPSDELVASVRASADALRRAGLDVGRACNLWSVDVDLSTPAVRLARAAGVDVIDGYVSNAARAGLGGPYHPFYIGPTDYRIPSQDGPTDAVAFVFDFCGSWHFHGPASYHRPTARGSWERARPHLDLAAREAVQVAANSRVHNVVSTLLTIVNPVAWSHHDGAHARQIYDDERGLGFFRRYVDLLAFEHARTLPIVFARAVDYADYFRAHHREMPRRVVSSVTHDVAYDRFWWQEWEQRGLSPAGYVPVGASLGDLRGARVMPQFNMPASHEFILYLENRRICRFEHACPKPTRYYAYDGSRAWGDRPQECELPDPDLTIRTRTSARRHEVAYEVGDTDAFDDYPVAIWQVPREFRDARVETDAREFLWVENTDGACHGIVRFDLRPRGGFTVTFCRA
jgi:hypothetical protein